MSTRDQLVRAAARLFLTRGYHAVGVSEICTSAGVHKGSFYHFFPHKSALGVAVVDHHATALWGLLDSYEAAARGPVEKIRATPEVVAHVQQRLYRAHGRVIGCPLGSLAVEVAVTEEAVGRSAAEALARWQQRIAGHCRDAQAVGLLGRGTTPEELAHQVVATMQGAILLAKISGSSPQEIPASMQRAIDAGVRRTRARTAG